MDDGKALSGSQYTSRTPPGASMPQFPQIADIAEAAVEIEAEIVELSAEAKSRSAELGEADIEVSKVW